MEQKTNKIEIRNDHKSEENRSDEKSDLKGDYGNVAILLLLYLLQGDKLKIQIKF
jgi:hypothetical protein